MIHLLVLAAEQTPAVPIPVQITAAVVTVPSVLMGTYAAYLAAKKTRLEIERLRLEREDEAAKLSDSDSQFRPDAAERLAAGAAAAVIQGLVTRFIPRLCRPGPLRAVV